MSGDEVKLRLSLLAASLGCAGAADMAPPGLFEAATALAAVGFFIVAWAPWDESK